MKKSYTSKKRTSVALDPELTRRLEKVLKGSDKKLSQYARDALTKKVEDDEIKQRLAKLEKLTGADQYQKIQRQQKDIDELKNTVKAVEKVDTVLKGRLNVVEKEVVEWRDVSQYVIDVSKKMGDDAKEKQKNVKKMLGSTHLSTKQYKKLFKNS